MSGRRIEQKRVKEIVEKQCRAMWRGKVGKRVE